MRIVELSDYSMVIMKDSQDPYWESVGNIYREAQRKKMHIKVEFITNYYSLKPIRESVSQISSEAVYTAGRLILFFSSPVSSNFQLNDNVEISVTYM